MHEEPKFYLKGWVSSKAFRRLLGVADYLGREKGLTVFKLSRNKIINKGLTPDDVVDILEGSGADYSDEVIEFLDSLRNSSSKSVTLSFDGSKIYAKFSTYLGELYPERFKDLLSYDRSSRLFYTYPYRYPDLISRLKGLNFSVVDLTGFSINRKLSVKIEFKGQLRDYQEEAINYWLRNGGKGIIALPTGSGKTVIGVAAIAKVSLKTLIIVYTKEQLLQWRKSLMEFTDAEQHMIGLYYSKEKRISDITLATYQTAYKYIHKLSPYFGFLVIDEVHHLPADKFKHIATSSPAAYRLGLSATPYREDGKHTYLFPLMGGVVYYKTPSELAKKGYLAPYRVITVKVSLSSNEKKEYDELRKLFKKYMVFGSFDDLVKEAQKGNLMAIKALRIHSRMLQIIQKSKSKLMKVKEIVEKELSSGKKIIIFAHYVEVAKAIADLVNGYLLTGSVKDEVRKKIIEEFKKSRSGVLVVTTVGDEGLDIPDASVGILVAGTGSRRQFIQRLGRLLRPGQGKEAVLYEIVAKGTSEESQARKRKKIRLDEFSRRKEWP